jgi:hypothetical protein
VVSDCLYAGNHSAAAKVIMGLDRQRYNPFNLVLGRPLAMFLCRVVPACEPEFEPLPAGINVISNDCWGHGYDAKLDWAQRLTKSLTSDPPPNGDIETIRRYMMVALSSHHGGETDPFQALCVHADDHAFGTRSTSVVTVSNQGSVEYWYSEDHPCQSPGLVRVGPSPT